MPSNRDENGRFVKGGPGGPGRSRKDPRIVEDSQRLSPEILARFQDILAGKAVKIVATDAEGNEKLVGIQQPTVRDQIAVGRILLAYAWGQPRNNVELKVGDVTKLTDEQLEALIPAALEAIEEAGIDVKGRA